MPVMSGDEFDREEDGATVIDVAESGVPMLPAIRGEEGPERRELLSVYMAEVRRYPVLDPEEERELALEYRATGDPNAAQRLVTANLRLVIKLAFQYHRQWSNVLDLIQEGNVGLVEALSRYDPARKIRFSSYAQYWIRAMILRFLMDNFRMVRLGTTRHGRKLFFQLKKERDRLLEQGQLASTRLLAENLQVPESEVVLMDLQLRAPALSLDSPVGPESEGKAALSEFVSGEEDVAVDDQVAAHELGALVKQHLDAFYDGLGDERSRVIWNERLVSADPASLSNIGDRYGISKERVRQLEVRIRKELRVFLEERMGDEIDFDFIPPGHD
jgi:RNA polymerase sigma-32 factor